MAKRFLRNLWSGAYGVAEGIVDTATFGLTDELTDKGYEELSELGASSEEGIRYGRQIRNIGNIGGAVAGGAITGNVTGAIQEGLEGGNALLQDSRKTSNTIKSYGDAVQSMSSYLDMLGGNLNSAKVVQGSTLDKGINTLSSVGKYGGLFLNELDSVKETNMVESNPTPINNNTMNNNFNSRRQYKYKDGGLVGDGFRPIEAEGNEYYDGEIVEGTLKGDSHKEGGIPMMAEKSAFIYPKGEFTKRKQKREQRLDYLRSKAIGLNKKLLKSSDNEAARNTLKRTFDKYAQEIEQLKMEDENDRQQIMELQEFEQGGYVYKKGGYVNKKGEPPASKKLPTNELEKELPTLENFPEIDPNLFEQMTSRGTEGFFENTQLPTNETQPFVNLDNASYKSNKANTDDNLDYNAGFTFGDAFQLAGSAIPLAYNIRQALKKPEVFTSRYIDEMSPYEISPEMGLRELRSGYRTGLQNLNSAQLSTGQRLSNASQLNTNFNRQAQDYQFKIDQANAELKFKTDATNRNIQAQNAQLYATQEEINAMNRGRKQLFGSVAATQGGNLLGDIGKGLNQKEQQELMVELMGETGYFGVDGRNSNINIKRNRNKSSVDPQLFFNLLGLFND